MPKCPACENEIARTDQTCPYCGRAVHGGITAPSPAGAADRETVTVEAGTVAEAKRLLEAGQRDQAIELLTSAGGLSRESAGMAAEALTSGAAQQVQTSQNVPVSPELFREMMKLLAAGQKLQAIKRLREETGLGLAEAKAVVDRLEPASARAKAGCTGALVGWLMRL